MGLPTDAAYYWVVTDKGGTKYFFGQTALSREFHPGPKTFRWYLDKVLDTNDVYWTVKWGHDGTTNTGLAPAQIAYSQAPGLGCNTTAGALAQCRTVDFYYKVRTTDVAINFSTGGSVSSKVLVDFIDIKLAGQMVRRHTMGYTLIDGTTARRLAPANLLTSVTEAGADLTPLPPIKFTYHTDANGGSVALNVTNYNFSPDETLGGDTEPGSCTHLVDVDGDGLTDVLVAKPGDYWWKRNIGGTFLPYQAIPSVGFPSLCNNKIDTTAVDYQLAGFNYSGYNPVTNIIYAMVNSVVQGIKIGGAAQTISPTNHSALIDIDGDGLVDIVDGSVAGTNAWTWRKNLGGGAFSAKFQLNASFDNKLGLKYVDYWGLPRVGEYRFADMDGDGLIDLLESAKFSRQFNRFLW